MATGFLDPSETTAWAYKNMTNGEPFTCTDYWTPFEWRYYTLSGPVQWEENLKDAEVFEMYVYNIILVDTGACEVVQQLENVVAESEKMAMLEVKMSELARGLHKEGRIKFIFTLVGGFNRFKKSEE